VKEIFFNSNFLRDNDSFNKEAGNLFISNFQKFEERVYEFSEESRKKETLIEEENYYEASKIRIKKIIGRNSFDPEKLRAMDDRIQTTEEFQATFDINKQKKIFFEEGTEHSNIILNKLKNDFSVSKSLTNKVEQNASFSNLDEMNSYEEINKKAEEFTKWFLSDYLESVKNISN